MAAPPLQERGFAGTVRISGPIFRDHGSLKKNEAPAGRKERQMKGYSTAAGYMGYVAWMGKYILFSTDEEYRDFLED